MNETVLEVLETEMRTAEGTLRSTLQTLYARCSNGIHESINCYLFTVSFDSLWAVI